MPDFVTEEDRTFTDPVSAVFEKPVREGGFSPEFDRTFTREDGGMLGVVDGPRGSEFYWRAPDSDEFVLAPREIVDDATKRTPSEPISSMEVAKGVSDADTLNRFNRLAPRAEMPGTFNLPPDRDPRNPEYDPKAPKGPRADLGY